jgi:ribosomal protein L34
MPVWESPSVTDEPEVSISQWRILETPDGQRYFVGHDDRHRTGRVSTPVRTFDPSIQQGESKSGRRYRMVGPPGRAVDGQWLWDRCCKVREVESYIDVTQQMLEGTSKA